MLRSLLLLFLVVTLTLALGARPAPFHRRYNTGENNSGENDGDDLEPITERNLTVCSKGGPCKCETGNDELKVLDCSETMIEDEWFVGNTLPLDTTEVRIANERFHPHIVDFSRNNIYKLWKGRILPGNEASVEKLDFSENQISSIEARAFDGFTSLRVLKLSDNHLDFYDIGREWLTVEIGGTLHQLFLDNNGLKDLQDGAFDNLYNLKKLVLDGNDGLQLTERTFGKALEFLEELSLDSCGIEALEENVLAPLRNLKALSLIGNPLISAPISFNSLPQLSELDISSTYNAMLWQKSSVHSSKLRVLFARDMPALYLVGECAFCGLPNLEVLDLSNSSKLFEISRWAFGLLEKGPVVYPRLSRLSFANCNLASLPEQLLDWDKVERLEIEGNPFNCDEDLAWLTSQSGVGKRLLRDSEARCAEPPILRGVPLNRVTEYQAYAVAHRMAAFRRQVLLVVVLAVSALVLTIALTIYCLRRIRHRNSYNILGQQQLILNDELATKPVDV